MELKFTLALPRDELTIPVVRRILSRSLEVLGVERECTADIELAITEACTNVLDHAREGDEYAVSAAISGRLCVIEITDTGAGFDAAALGNQNADPSAEAGRGIQLIRALVDRVRFDARVDHGGTVVHLEKWLEWRDGSPIERLMELQDSAPASD